MDPFKKNIEDLDYSDIRKIYRRRVMEQGIRLSRETPEEFYQRWEKSSFFERIPLIPGNSESCIVFDTEFMSIGELTLEEACFLNLLFQTSEECDFEKPGKVIQFFVCPVSVILDLCGKSKSKMENLLEMTEDNGVIYKFNEKRTMIGFVIKLNK